MPLISWQYIAKNLNSHKTVKLTKCLENHAKTLETSWITTNQTKWTLTLIKSLTNIISELLEHKHNKDEIINPCKQLITELKINK